MPHVKDKQFTRRRTIFAPAFQEELVNEVRERRLRHYELMRTLRPHSAEEWFELWPSSMDNMLPHLSGNRRLFRSYEPFMSNDAIKISAALPQKWKLNRVLFQKMAKPFFKQSKHLPHADGWLPYYSWHLNTFYYGLIWCWRRVGLKVGLITGNQGPWNDWRRVLSSAEWQAAIRRNVSSSTLPPGLFANSLDELFNANILSIGQKINLMQVLYQCRDTAHDA